MSDDPITEAAEMLRRHRREKVHDEVYAAVYARTWLVGGVSEQAFSDARTFACRHASAAAKHAAENLPEAPK